MKNDEGSQRKYPYTKQLVRIAREIGGLRHADIARRARLSPKSVSQVHRWASGTSLATYGQMENLLAEFGDHLKKVVEHMFCRLKRIADQNVWERYAQISPQATIEINDQTRPVAELTLDERAFLEGREFFMRFKTPLEDDALDTYEFLYSVEGESPVFSFFKIRGESLFRHTLHHSFEHDKTYRRHAMHRLEIIRRDDSSWYAITQNRLVRSSPNKCGRGAFLPLHSSVEGATWSSEWHHIRSVDALLAFVDDYPRTFCFFKDSRIEAMATLPFIVRKRLLELGYTLKEIVDINDKPSDH